MHTLLLLISLMRALFGILKSQSPHQDLALLALSKVFLSCWNEQKQLHTRVELLFKRQPEKRTVMSFCGVTGRSGQFNPRTSKNELIGRWQGLISIDRTRPVA